MRSPVREFCYTAVLGEADIRDSEVSVLACASGPDQARPQLAGQTPIIRFLSDKMVLIPAPGADTDLRWCSFSIGDVIVRAARVGDRITVSRDVLDAVVVALLRDQCLRVAVGALSIASLDMDPNVRLMPYRDSAPGFHVVIGGNTYAVRERESIIADGYEVYVERGIYRNKWGEGPNASLSIAAIGDVVVMNSARRSAVLMADQHVDPLCGERLDGTMIHSRYLIG